MIKEYYDILSLKRDASPQEIAQQYKRLVLRWHPRFAKEEQKTAHFHFSQISEAYEVLSDPLKRAFYDRHGYLKLRQGLFSQGQLKGGYRFADNPDEIFQRFFHQHNPLAQTVDKTIIERGSLFGHAFGGLNFKENHRLDHLTVSVHCTLHELYLGVAKHISYERRVLNLDGRTTSLRKQQRILQIKPGYNSQTKLVFTEQGHESINRKNSDLIINIIEQKHSHYIRNSNDLIYSITIDLHQALSCQNIQIKTLDNRILRVSIDQIVSPSTIKVVNGQGFNSKGDLYIRFNITFPRKLEESTRNELRSLLA